MQWRDIKPGVEVYHNLMTHFGKGVVVGIAVVDPIVFLFERGGMKRVRVKFEAHDTTTDVLLRSLRKKPNKQRIAMMAKLKAERAERAALKGL